MNNFTISENIISSLCSDILGHKETSLIMEPSFDVLDSIINESTTAELSGIEFLDSMDWQVPATKQRKLSLNIIGKTKVPSVSYTYSAYPAATTGRGSSEKQKVKENILKARLTEVYNAVSSPYLKARELVELRALLMLDIDNVIDGLYD